MDNKLWKHIKNLGKLGGKSIVFFKDSFVTHPKLKLKCRSCGIQCSVHRDSILSDGDDLEETQIPRHKTGSVTE